MNVRDWVLSPSDFAFLWEECRRCFYLKVVRGFRRPSSPFPKIFHSIDTAMKAYYGKRHTRDVMPFLPGGIIEPGDHAVESSPLAVPHHSSRCIIRGKMDTFIRLDDGTFAIVDFKTSETKPEYLALYSRQLHAYTLGVENPAPSRLGLRPVTKLGLVVFEPRSFESGIDKTAEFSGALAWQEIPRKDQEFLGFLDQLLSVLELPEPPAGAASCNWCGYREASRRNGL